MTHLQSVSWFYIDTEVYVLREEMAQTFNREFYDLPPLPDLTYYADDTDPYNF